MARDVEAKVGNAIPRIRVHGPRLSSSLILPSPTPHPLRQYPTNSCSGPRRRVPSRRVPDLVFNNSNSSLHLSIMSQRTRPFRKYLREIGFGTRTPSHLVKRRLSLHRVPSSLSDDPLSPTRLLIAPQVVDTIPKSITSQEDASIDGRPQHPPCTASIPPPRSPPRPRRPPPPTISPPRPLNPSRRPPSSSGSTQPPLDSPGSSPKTKSHPVPVPRPSEKTRGKQTTRTIVSQGHGKVSEQWELVEEGVSFSYPLPQLPHSHSLPEKNQGELSHLNQASNPDSPLPPLPPPRLKTPSNPLPILYPTIISNSPSHPPNIPVSTLAIRSSPNLLLLLRRQRFIVLSLDRLVYIL